MIRLSFMLTLLRVAKGKTYSFCLAALMTGRLMVVVARRLTPIRSKMGSGTKKSLLLACLAVIALAMSGFVSAQASAVTPMPEPAVPEAATVGRTFTAEDFQRFTPRNALDMLNQVPGFTVRRGGQGRGLGQANTNVLVNGLRLSSKSQDVFDQLRRVTVDNVERIEIIDGATLEIPGLSGQVANVITLGGDNSGRYEYRTSHRPRYAEPSWIGGEMSVSGSTSRLEWNAAYSHGAGRGAAGGLGFISDEFGNVTEWRDIHWHFEGEFPSVSGNLKWDGSDSMVANLNVQYSRDYTQFSHDEERDLVTGVDRFRDFGNRGRNSSYEISADLDFEFGPGRMKLIGLESFKDNDFQSDAVLIFEDDSPSTGNRFASQSESGERIGRAEYRWDRLGGNWQLDAEAAFNRLDKASQLFSLDTTGNLVETLLPNSTGEVTEERYEMILTHGRTLGEGLAMQLGVGAENSELAQSGPGGLTRTFWRPKGLFSLAWTTEKEFDVSFKLARTVGQLSFGQFLAQVNLETENANAGNVELRPTLNWESDLEIEKALGKWGSSNLRLYARWSEDYIDIIPLPGGGESHGNIDSAQLYGIAWNSTINLDPIGWEAAKIDLRLTAEESSVEDPLTGVSRSFSNHYDRRGDISLRHDIPGSDWAWGVGIQYSHVLPSYRLSEVGLNYEGPIYTSAFVEHKNVFGLTARLNVFNLTDGRALFNRTVYTGLRDDSSVLYIEHRDLSVQPIIGFKLTGNF